MPMDWDKLRVFNAVAEAGSFTHASETLHLSQSAISRQISGLEDSLGVPLFHRHARGLVKTEQGEILHETVTKVFKQLNDVRSIMDDTKDHPTGALRITTTVALGSTWLPHIIKEFIQEYPHIDVNLFLTDDVLNLQTRQADVALMINQPNQLDLIQKPLVDFEFHVYASESYLKQYGEPKKISDLDKHAIISYGDFGAGASYKLRNWLLTEGTDKPRDPVMTVNNYYGIYRAVRAGIGIAALPSYIVPENVGIRPILVDKTERHDVTCYFTYHEAMRNSKRIRVFLEFIEAKLKERGLKWSVDFAQEK